MKRPLLSVVIPAFNEEENVANTAHVLGQVLAEANIRYELIFVSDGSKDKTFGEVLKLSRSGAPVRGIEFSRNFGKEAAIFAGLAKVQGDCAVVMDCDLQHPPQTVVEMFRLWEQGYEVVEGVKNTRGRESFLHKLFAGAFYKIISGLTGFDMKNASDFKLLSKNVVQILLDMPERKTFFRALSFWVGFKTCQVHYDVQDRAFGKTKWSPVKLIRYAISNIVAFSTRPLNIVTYIGVAALLAGAILTVQTIINWARGVALEGFTTVILLLLFLGGGILLGLGLIGQYVAAIYEEVKGRPRYVVRLDTDKLQDKGQ